MNTPRERRQFKRSDFPVSAYVDLVGQEIGVQLLDFSLKGARLENDGRWKAEAGQQCQLRVNLGPKVVIEMPALVHRVDAQYIALQAIQAAQLRNLA